MNFWKTSYEWVYTHTFEDCKVGVGSLFSAKRRLDIYNIIHGAYKIIN